jgi:hypothetical protein
MADKFAMRKVMLDRLNEAKKAKKAKPINTKTETKKETKQEPSEE